MIISLVAIGFWALWNLLFLPLSVDHTPLCGSCHAVSRAYRTARLSAHKNVGCLACHRNQSVGGRLALDFRGVRNLAAAFGGASPHRQHVDNDACLTCHNKIAVGVVKTGKIKMSHREVVEAGWRCATCHGGAGHELGGAKSGLQRPSMDKCAGCHLSQPSLRACRTCHTGAPAPGGEKKPAALGALAHTKDWKTNHGAAPVGGCPICHKGTFCKSCHKVSLPHNKTSWSYEHGDVARADGKPCESCHKPEFCRDCHQTPMPHPADFGRGHGADKNSAKPLCFNCHLKYQCEACHSTHKTHRVMR